MRTEKTHILGTRRGFTAIELTAVASIIAILALILIPIVRTRLESARQTAALDDLRSIETAEVLANADIARYLPLQYLDNPAPDIDTFNNPASTALDRANATRSVPNGGWNQPFNGVEQAFQNQLGSIGALWKGPYITYNKTKFVDISTFADSTAVGDGSTQSTNAAFRVYDFATGNSVGTILGPMVIYADSGGGTADPFNDDLFNRERYPIDPWGGPYIYYGPGRVGNLAGATDPLPGGIPETNFGTSAAYSMGPDGVPGLGFDPNNPDNYRRELDILGNGDDFVRIF